MARRRWPRILAYVFGALVLLVVVAYVVASSRIDRALSKRYPIAAVSLPTSDSTSLARGAHLSQTLGCPECHGGDLGGKLMGDAPPFRLETINLTRGTGGVGAQLTPAAFEHAVRRGVGHDGRPLVVMPRFALSDADVVALHAYVSSLAPVNRQAGGVVIKPLGKLIFGLGGIPDFHPDQIGKGTFAATTPTGATAEHGQYWVNVTCRHCHGEDLRGAQPPNPDSPAAPSLEPSSRWSDAQFATAMREGVRPSGPKMDSTFMPWTYFRHMTDEEVQAVHAYLKDHFGGGTRTAHR
ncbi:MAG TPA: cytochrome c [Rhodothermales bacterium]|nr:cytochrome c [Rhodothermales bacterium]